MSKTICIVCILFSSLALQECKTCDCASVREASTGALWELFEGKLEGTVHPDTIVLNQAATDALHSPHVMISYQWDSQEQMLQVKERLTSAGFNVWMDVDKMGKTQSFNPRCLLFFSFHRRCTVDLND